MREKSNQINTSGSKKNHFGMMDDLQGKGEYWCSITLYLSPHNRLSTQLDADAGAP